MKTGSKKSTRPLLIVIVGPTASGKSDLAVALAKKIHGEIISADSRQVYKGLDNGTGKITKREMKNVPHYLLDVANPKKQFTVVQYVTHATQALEKITSRGKTAIIVGGTGFYIQALVDGMILPDVPPNRKLRAKLQNKSAAVLYVMLQKLDVQRSKHIDPLNSRRLIRAIEIARALGKVPRLKKKPLPYDVRFIGLDVPPSRLKERIGIRLRKRLPTERNGLRNNMIEEVRRLHIKGLSWKRMEELGLEYRYLALYLQKKMTKEEMIEKLTIEIWRYAKRQLTWFRRDDRIMWIKEPFLKNTLGAILTR